MLWTKAVEKNESYIFHFWGNYKGLCWIWGSHSGGYYEEFIFWDITLLNLSANVSEEHVTIVFGMKEQVMQRAISTGSLDFMDYVALYPRT